MGRGTWRISYIIHSIQSVKKDYITKAAVCCCPHSNVVGIPQDLIADQRSDLNPASDHKGAMHISLFLCLCILPHKHPDQREEISAELAKLQEEEQ